MMRKSILFSTYVIVLILCLCGISVYAQQPVNKPTRFPLDFNTKWSAIGLRFQGQDFYVSESPIDDTCNCLPQSLRTRGNSGLLFSFYRSTGSRLSYSLNLGFSSGRVGTKPVPTIRALKDNFTSFRGDLYYHMGPNNQSVSPYLHTGLHAQLGEFYASLPTGLGLRYLSKKSPLMLTSEVNYGWGITNQLRNNLIFSFGLHVRLNAKQTAISPASPIGGILADPNSCLDSDFDGVPDGGDKCPRLPGSPLNAGCPICDTDADGVTDDKDKCPTIPGPINHFGCPAPDTIYITKEVPLLTQAGFTGSGFPALSFFPNSNVLDSSTTTLLDLYTLTIRNNPGSRYTIYGYSGPSKIEKQRSIEQVTTVINYLIDKQGINPDRLVARAGLQGGNPNTVKIRVAVDGEKMEDSLEAIKKKTNY
jgi:hypothetical protein